MDVLKCNHYGGRDNTEDAARDIEQGTSQHSMEKARDGSQQKVNLSLRQ